MNPVIQQLTDTADQAGKLLQHHLNPNTHFILLCVQHDPEINTARIVAVSNFADRRNTVLALQQAVTLVQHPSTQETPPNAVWN